MYKAIITNGGQEEYLYHPADEELILLNPVITQKMGKYDSFEFGIAPNHLVYSRIHSLSSQITVFDGEEILYRGRPMGVSEDFNGIRKYHCEGEYAYLNDSIIRPFSMECSVDTFFRKVIESHNSQVEPMKQFTVGNIHIVGDSDKILFESLSYENALKVLSRNLVDMYGGYLRIRYAADKNYIDWVNDYGGINEQPVRYGENLLDLNRNVDPTQIFSVMIPTGAKISEGETDYLVTIESVNGGKDFIVDQAMVDQYGWVACYKSFPNVTDPATLLSLARLSLRDIRGIPDNIITNAIDLGILDSDVVKMKTGYWTDVISPVHGLNKKMLLQERTFNLLDPGKDKIILGRRARTLSIAMTANQAETNRVIQKLERDTIKDIIHKVENATNLITGGLGGYVVLDVEDPLTGKRAMPWRILIMDTPDKETAKSVIQINKNGIGFSTTGINGPYANAWTIDGNLVADFITAGTMLADRIRGGMLELGGTGLGKDGEFIVRDAIGNEIARIDVNGLQAKYKVNGKDVVGFVANGKLIRLGDFEVQTLYGRQVLQSIDECTGISGEPDEDGKLYFWAGYQSDTRYGMLINTELSTYVQDLWMARWKDEWFDSAERNFPSSVKLDRKSFEQWPVGKMLVDGYQWQNWLIDTMGKIIDKLDRRISDLENM